MDSTYSLRTINFTGNGPYTLNGGGSLAFTSSAAVNVMAGSHTISTGVNLGGDLTASVRSGSTLTMTNIASNGNSLLKAGAGTLELANARFNTPDIVGGKVKIQLAGTLASVSNGNALAISPNGTLDLTNNDMVMDYAGTSPLGTWNGSAYTGVLGALQSGRNGGTWNGPGIITSESSAVGGPPQMTLGVAEASTVLGLSGGATAVWRGQIVDATSLLIRHTYAGDADLNGQIDADDYFVIDSNYNKSGAVFGYANGDFDYNGTIDADDFFIIDSTFSAQGPPLGPIVAEVAGAISVPEPAALALAALASFPLRHRRRALKRLRPNLYGLGICGGRVERLSAEEAISKTASRCPRGLATRPPPSAASATPSSRRRMRLARQGSFRSRRPGPTRPSSG